LESGLPDFLGTPYQNGKNVPKNNKYTKWSQNMPTSSIPRPSKIDQNWDFGFENMAPGNPNWSGLEVQGIRV
jgi:hypothetical protein